MEIPLDIGSCKENYIFDVPTLKRLRLTFSQATLANKLVLNVPNLEYFFVGRILCSLFVMENSPSFDKAKVSYEVVHDHMWVELLKAVSEAKSISSTINFEFILRLHATIAPVSDDRPNGFTFSKASKSTKHLELIFVFHCYKFVLHQKSDGSRWHEPQYVPTCMLMNLMTMKFEDTKRSGFDLQIGKIEGFEEVNGHISNIFNPT
ncbi:FBD domain, Leucine-rich repeat domain, L domain-like protein [Artemisia annua]|uniref:FBD domain, Leucine-rich repeat domain, L domain-like protein n=1 Tax=Artemisia annua TaxID=35608 RepID=A0A2U1Q5I7_ARTAN|nr:FBD domain, Leucine-rich repeat domain, L domain-like protein [Artemisia annua]